MQPFFLGLHRDWLFLQPSLISHGRHCYRNDSTCRKAHFSFTPFGLLSSHAHCALAHRNARGTVDIGSPLNSRARTMPHEVAAIRRSSISISRTPEEKYRNKHICATGKISDYKGVPEIVAYDPSQINVR